MCSNQNSTYNPDNDWEQYNCKTADGKNLMKTVQAKCCNGQTFDKSCCQQLSSNAMCDDNITPDQTSTDCTFTDICKGTSGASRFRQVSDPAPVIKSNLIFEIAMVVGVLLLLFFITWFFLKKKKVTFKSSLDSDYYN
jgi:hypothetical protein